MSSNPHPLQLDPVLQVLAKNLEHKELADYRFVCSSWNSALKPVLFEKSKLRLYWKELVKNKNALLQAFPLPSTENPNPNDNLIPIPKTIKLASDHDQHHFQFPIRDLTESALSSGIISWLEAYGPQIDHLEIECGRYMGNYILPWFNSFSTFVGQFFPSLTHLVVLNVSGCWTSSLQNLLPVFPSIKILQIGERRGSNFLDTSQIKFIQGVLSSMTNELEVLKLWVTQNIVPGMKEYFEMADQKGILIGLKELDLTFGVTRPQSLAILERVRFKGLKRLFIGDFFDEQNDPPNHCVPSLMNILENVKDTLQEFQLQGWWLQHEFRVSDNLRRSTLLALLPYIKSLRNFTFTFVPSFESVNITFMKKLPNLRVLVLTNPISLFEEILKKLATFDGDDSQFKHENLRELKIGDISYDVKYFAKLIDCFPKLKVLQFQFAYRLTEEEWDSLDCDPDGHKILYLSRIIWHVGKKLRDLEELTFMSSPFFSDSDFMRCVLPFLPQLKAFKRCELASPGNAVVTSLTA